MWRVDLVDKLEGRRCVEQITDSRRLRSEY
jgi:hypothetical protein